MWQLAILSLYGFGVNSICRNDRLTSALNGFLLPREMSVDVLPLRYLSCLLIRSSPPRLHICPRLASTGGRCSWSVLIATPEQITSSLCNTEPLRCTIHPVLELAPIFTMMPSLPPHTYSPEPSGNSSGASKPAKEAILPKATKHEYY